MAGAAVMCRRLYNLVRDPRQAWADTESSVSVTLYAQTQADRTDSKNDVAKKYTNTQY